MYGNQPYEIIGGDYGGIKVYDCNVKSSTLRGLSCAGDYFGERYFQIFTRNIIGITACNLELLQMVLLVLLIMGGSLYQEVLLIIFNSITSMMFL